MSQSPQLPGSQNPWQDDHKPNPISSASQKPWYADPSQVGPLPSGYNSPAPKTSKKTIAALIVAGLLVFCVISGIYSSITGKRSDNQTATSQAQDLLAISDKTRAAGLPTPTQPPTVTPVPTNTLVPTPTITPTPAPTKSPTPLPSIGSKIHLGGWDFTLDGVKTHDVIEWSDVGNTYKASGLFYVYRVSSVNTNNATYSFANSFEVGLKDDHGAEYTDIAVDNPYSMGQYALINGFTEQKAGITPRTAAKYLLVFDVAPDAKPVTLRIKDKLSHAYSDFELK